MQLLHPAHAAGGRARCMDVAVIVRTRIAQPSGLADWTGHLARAGVVVVLRFVPSVLVRRVERFYVRVFLQSTAFEFSEYRFPRSHYLFHRMFLRLATLQAGQCLGRSGHTLSSASHSILPRNCTTHHCTQRRLALAVPLSRFTVICPAWHSSIVSCLPLFVLCAQVIHRKHHFKQWHFVFFALQRY